LHSTGIRARHRFFAVKDTTLFETHPVAAVLIIVGFIAAIFLFIFGSRWQFAKSAGWKDLVLQFPAPEIARPGDTFKKMSGWIGSMEFRQGFQVQLIQEGLRIVACFAPHSPVLIPWSQISEVQVSEGRFLGYEQNIILKAEWEKPLQFSLPPAVLPTVEKNVPAGRFRKVKIPSSIGELLKERWSQRRR